MKKQEQVNNNTIEPAGESKTASPAKRTLAWIGIAVIALWFIATMLIAVLPVANKDRWFPLFVIGCIIIPVFLWIVLWLVGLLTGKRTVASFRSEETQETMRKADEIRYGMMAGTVPTDPAADTDADTDTDTNADADTDADKSTE